MPIYEYRCHDCNAVFAKIQSVGASIDGLKCPECESTEIARVLSVFSSAGGGLEQGAPTGGGCGSGGFT